MKNEISVYTSALAEWGGSAQVGMVHEEIGELLVEVGSLMVAINKYDRGQVELEDILEEIVDVEIMMEQLTLVLALSAEDPKVEAMIDKKLKIREAKLERLQRRVDASIAERESNNSGTTE